MRRVADTEISWRNLMKMKGLAVWIAFGLCAHGCSKGPKVDPDPTVRTVAVTGAPTSFFVPATSQLTATAMLSNNTTQTVTSTANWDSSNPAVATVSGGLVTARTPGSSEISATYQTVRGSATVTVGAPALTARPGGPYQTQHDADVTFSGLASTSTPNPIATYSWNCGQAVAANCTSAVPTPTFRYRKCGVANRPACRSGSSNVADYTVTLTITDSQGNTSQPATTTVTVTNSY
jgi:hypothetical protein